MAKRSAKLKHGKPKKKKSGRPSMADKVNKRNSVTAKSKSMNPFELHINKQKQSVLGQPTKHEKGLPGIARSKAIKKRKGTLLKEYQGQNSANVFLDRRIGEKSKTWNPEEKMFARFTAERMSHHKSKSIYNLTEDEPLTHKGHLLSEIEKFDDGGSSDDDLEEAENLANEFVEKAHFGGFLTKKQDEKPKTRKELIDELIFESKRRKAERQKDKEETVGLTSRLDAEWKTMTEVVGFKKGAKTDDEPPVGVKQYDPYDMLVRQLKFDGRAQASDRIKTAEELAREGKEKLEKMEDERQQRMKGVGGTTVPTHTSADAIDDDHYHIEDKFILSYKDGKAVELDQDKSEEIAIEYKTCDKSEENGTDESSDGDNEDEESDSDDYSDLESEDEGETKVKKIEKKSKVLIEPMKEIPYTFEVPGSYEELETLLKSYSPLNQSTIVERMITCNHPALGNNNKMKIQGLFVYLLQYIHDCAENYCGDDKEVEVISYFVPHLWDVLQVDSVHFSKCLLDVVKEKYHDFLKSKNYPDYSMLVFLKICVILYPTSDFEHPVLTPVQLFITHILYKCKVTTMQDVVKGLFLCTLMKEMTKESHRFSPEVINFLQGILYISIPKRTDNQTLPPSNFIEKQMLLLNQPVVSEVVDLCEADLVGDNSNDALKVSCIKKALELVHYFYNSLSSLPSHKHIFTSIKKLCELLPRNMYSESICDTLSNLFKSGVENKVHLKSLEQDKGRPKPLRLYEPKFDDRFDGRKKHVGSQKKLEQQKLTHKYKKEMKSAVREIRKDNAFIAEKKLQEQIARDNVRKRKVKELLSSLGTQEGDFRKLKRLKEN